MAKDSKKKGKAAHDAHAARGAHAPHLDGRGTRLDAKLAKVVAKRMKKLRVELAEATRREGKKVRALDKAHRRRQLIQAAIDELSMDVVPPSAPTASPAPGTPAAPTAKPAAPAKPAARSAAAKPPAKPTAKPAAARTRKPATPKG